MTWVAIHEAQHCCTWLKVSFLIAIAIGFRYRVDNKRRRDMSNLDRKISVIGLGYVGLPVAIAFGQVKQTIGFDINSARIAMLKSGHDFTNEVSEEELKSAKIHYTSDLNDLKMADFHIVAVPTPIDNANQPDLTPLLKATESVGRILKKGDIVVYESTVYPGATEEDCVPILEKCSGLRSGVDFTVGYSPERINPGDKVHRFTTIKKVVSGQDQRTLDIVAAVYGSVVTAGVFKATSIKVAEAAKVIENTQRDLNIALMNELALVFDRMGIATREVLEAAGTKWNFLKFTPGLVGGHCIGVDPYYLTHKAEKLKYIPQVILAGRKVNDNMGAFIAQKTVKEMIHAGHNIHGCTVTVLGLTFKEDVPDLRNSKVMDIIQELRSFGMTVQVHDPLADPVEAKHEYGIELKKWEELNPSQALVVAVAHQQYKRKSIEELRRLVPNKPVLIDVKNIFHRTTVVEAGFRYWEL